VTLGRRAETVALAAILGVAALTRLVRLDLMEFKADEAEAYRLALHVLGHAEPGVGTFFPTAGLVASVDVPNPPLFPYLLAAPVVLVRSPLAAAVFIALANVAAVWLCHLAGKRCFSTFVGLGAAALLALSPWAIVYSRKLWAQDLLVPLTCIFLLALHALVVERRPRAVLWLFVLAAAATQLHFSAWVLAVVLALALVFAREAVTWRWTAAGAAAALLLYAPFLWHLAVVGREATPGAPPHLGSPTAPALPHRFLTSARDTLALSGGDRLSGLVGSQPFYALPLSVLVGGCGLAGLVLAWRRARAEADANLRLLLILWFVLPLAALTVLRIAPFPHYFIVLYPLPFLGFAFLLEEAARHRAALAGLAAVLALFAALDGWLFATVRDHRGAPADYGVAYRDKADAARALLKANPGTRIRLTAPPEYGVLVWNEQGANDAPRPPSAAAYVVTESFDGRERVRFREEGAGG
jgi:4-amino-4-deoxy-L-arabinose transferase-like glycosyltransferase